MSYLIVVAAVVVPALVNISLLLRLREYRVDLTQGQSMFDGASAIWQRNVLRPSNYNAKGRRLLAWYWVALLVQLLGIAGAVLLFVR